MTYSDLTNLDTLKKLAGAKGGDATFNENGSITLKEQSPITVKQLSAENTLNITTQGNTFVSGTDDTKFNVNTPINADEGKVVLMTGKGIDATKGITAKEIELYAGAGDLNANLIAEIKDVTETVTEPTVITTITYTTKILPINIFGKYSGVPGFSITSKSEGILFNNNRRTYTLTATYDPNDTNILNQLNQIMNEVKGSNYVATFSRTDAEGTRSVEKTTTVKQDIGTLTANALNNININANSNLPIKNVTSGKDTTIKADGNIVPYDKNSFIRAEDVYLTANDHIGTESNWLTIYADAMELNAKHVYVLKV